MSQRGRAASIASNGSTDFESADESLSRGSSYTAGQRRSLDVASRTSSAASVRGMGPAGAAATTADTASSPERRQPRGQGDDAAAAAAGSQGQAAANSEAAAAAEQLQAVALDDDDDTPGSPAAAAASAAASEAEAEAPSKEPEQQPAAQQQQPVIEQPAQPPSAQQPAQPPPAGAQPPGASLFSVPMASAPTTGIYSIPQEMFRIKDLDAGKEYSLDQRYWIKDMDTGAVYVLQGDDGPATSAGAGGAGGPSTAALGSGPLGSGPSGAGSAGGGGGGGGAGGSRVTELLSGRELTLNEFEDALGFFREPQPAPVPPHMLPEDQGGAAAEPGGGGGGQGGKAAMAAAAQRSFKSFTSGATWVKSSVGGMLSSLKTASSPGQSARGSGGGGGSGPGSPGGGEPGGGSAGAALGYSGVERSVGSGSGPPGALSVTDDRQGQPVKVQVYRKSFREFTDLRLVQQMGGHAGVVWSMKFSRNGRFLASAGQDCVVRVWELSPSRGSGSAPTSPAHLPTGAEVDVPLAEGGEGGGSGGEGGAAASGSGGSVLADPSLAVFQQRPYRVYRGHKQDVLDLCWSKTQFLLSASMDKTVRLWHVSMDECLRVFKHTDFVTAIDFHPLDDKVFLSGSIDGKVRLWSIPEQRVASWQDVHEMVTAVTYSPDGRKAVVGTMKGKCRFYTIEKSTLEYEAQLDVKNKRGQHARGKKVTGLAFLPSEPGKLLITSNDSRVRLYDGYTLRCKYKGHTNRNTQIRASFSPGGDYITCGSDDGWVYLWGTHKSAVPAAGGAAAAAAAANPLAKEKNASYECFQANGDIVTVAVFAPPACHRPADSLSPTADAGRHQRSDSLGDRAEGEAALMAARARGQVLVTAGYTGEIRVYENIGLPQWL